MGASLGHSALATCAYVLHILAPTLHQRQKAFVNARFDPTVALLEDADSPSTFLSQQAYLPRSTSKTSAHDSVIGDGSSTVSESTIGRRRVLNPRALSRKCSRKCTRECKQRCPRKCTRRLRFSVQSAPEGVHEDSHESAHRKFDSAE